MKQYLLRLINGETLSQEDTHQIMLNIVEEKYNLQQIAALLMAIQTRGATVAEMLGFRQGLLETGKYINLEAEQQWSTVTENEIFEQDFVEGRKLKVGTTVKVKVSKGIRQIEIQDLTDRTADAAERQLKKDGFKVATSHQ